MRRVFLVLLPLAGLVAGCPVTQPQATPVAPLHVVEPKTEAEYWLYVPSFYSDQRDWPLVITLHGTHGWDGYEQQIKEWKYLAEERGLIVAAPKLRSVQGILPVVRDLWYQDLAADERDVLAVLDDVAGRYRVDRSAVLLTGFSAGGYPMYYTGLRNPGRFNMLIARACNSSMELFQRIEIAEQARGLPVAIFWGRDDLKPLQDQSWEAFDYLRRVQRFRLVQRKEIKGGHIRRPDLAYEMWRPRLAERHRM